MSPRLKQLVQQDIVPYFLPIRPEVQGLEKQFRGEALIGPAGVFPAVVVEQTAVAEGDVLVSVGGAAPAQVEKAADRAVPGEDVGPPAGT